LGEGIVHAIWKHIGEHEQGTATGRWSWIISKLERFVFKTKFTESITSVSGVGFWLKILKNKPALIDTHTIIRQDKRRNDKQNLPGLYGSERFCFYWFYGTSAI